jgi:uncharacterized protein YndB with AHSA1/START domain
VTRISEKMSAISFQRAFRQSPEAVFAAFSNQDLKGKWFTGPADATIQERMLDCRIGGREVLEVRWASGTVTRFEARYHAVELTSRLVYSYDLFIDSVLYSVSLTDILFSRDGSGTAVNFTETTTYFSDQDLGEMTASRLHGTKAQFDMLASALAGEAVVSAIDDCH